MTEKGSRDSSGGGLAKPNPPPPASWMADDADADPACELVALAEDWQERRRLVILHGRDLRSGILYGRTLCLYGRTFCACTLRPPNLFSEVLRTHLCPCVVDSPDLPALLHEPMRCSNILRGRCRSILRSRCWSILHNLCRGILHSRRGTILHNLRRSILNRLYGPAMRLRILLRRPCLELPKQGFRC